MNAMDLRRRLTLAVDAALTNLKSIARMISSLEEIAQDGKALCNELEVESMKLDRGYISPYFITNQMNHSNLQDLAILTGGRVNTEELGMNHDNLELDMLDLCKKVSISKDNGLILDGAGQKYSIEQRFEEIRPSTELSISHYDEEKLQGLAKLPGGGAILKMHPPELLLHFLQRFKNHLNVVKQVQSLIITNGHLHIKDQWINTLLYNALIKSYLKFFMPRISLLLFIQMLRHQAPPNSYTFPSVLKATVSLSGLYRVSPMCCSINSQCVRRGLLADPFVRTSIISLYSQIGDMESAWKIFNEMSQQCLVLCNAMLDGFAKNGNMDCAISTFSSMPKRDVYSWTSIVSGYTQNGYFREAVNFFTEMMADDDAIKGSLRPNEATFVSVLSSCGNLDDGFALYQGKQIHGYVIRSNELGAFVGTALIALYGKMGCLSYAFRVFNSMAVKKVCTWNAMICSFASNGREIKALETFHTMKTMGLQPDEVTFVGILSACARTKLVNRGMELFQSMSSEFGIAPRMEHYGCVVDLLSRAGLLKEAYEFVTSMPFKADASVLGALLGACKVHGDVSLGNEVGRQLLELQPGHCGRYVVLSSIYAGAEIWDNAFALRKAMVNAGIQKIPAFSMAD